MASEAAFKIPKEAVNNSDVVYYAADLSLTGETRRTITVYVRTRHASAEVVGVDRSW